MLQILHAVLFRCVKQCSMCFLAEVCFIFEMLSMQKHIFPRTSLNWGSFVEWKTKETFCFAKWWSLHDNIILIAYYCFNRPDLNLFCCDTSSIQDRSTFFSLCSFSSFKNQDIFLKKKCYIVEKSWRHILHRLLWQNTTREFWLNMKANAIRTEKRCNALKLFRQISVLCKSNANKFQRNSSLFVAFQTSFAWNDISMKFPRIFMTPIFLICTIFWMIIHFAWWFTSKFWAITCSPWKVAAIFRMIIRSSQKFDLLTEI